MGFGLGFIVDYEGNKFFVTTDHTIHIDDCKGETEERTWKDYRVVIFTNCRNPHNFLSTAITPLGGFYYMERFNLDWPVDLSTPVDVTVCKMRDVNFQVPFLTDNVDFTNGEIIKAGEQKFAIFKEAFSEPRENIDYFIFEKVKVRIVDSIRVEWQNTLKASLKFVKTSGDFLLFTTPASIDDKSEWEGFSGAAVISEEGECVGVLCDVLENSKAVWVIPISKVKLLIEVAIQ